MEEGRRTEEEGSTCRWEGEKEREEEEEKGEDGRREQEEKEKGEEEQRGERMRIFKLGLLHYEAY